MPENNTKNMNRRGALTLIVATLAAGWSLAAAALAGLFVSSPLRTPAASSEVLLGTTDTFTPKFQAVLLTRDIQDGWHRRTDHQMVYARQNETGNIEVLSARCTHLGCTVRWNADADHFACPCHEGSFAADGQVLGGAPTLPLERIPTTIRGNDIYVTLT